MDLSYGPEYAQFRAEVCAFLESNWPPRGEEAELVLVRRHEKEIVARSQSIHPQLKQERERSHEAASGELEIAFAGSEASSRAQKRSVTAEVIDRG